MQVHARIQYGIATDARLHIGVSRLMNAHALVRALYLIILQVSALLCNVNLRSTNCLPEDWPMPTGPRPAMTHAGPTPAHPCHTGLPYTSSNVQSSDSCRPGTTLCRNSKSFYTCGQFTRGSTRWTWGALRNVAPGTTCISKVSPGSLIKSWRSEVFKQITRNERYSVEGTGSNAVNSPSVFEIIVSPFKKLTNLFKRDENDDDSENDNNDNNSTTVEDIDNPWDDLEHVGESISNADGNDTPRWMHNDDDEPPVDDSDAPTSIKEIDPTELPDDEEGDGDDGDDGEIAGEDEGEIADVGDEVGDVAETAADVGEVGEAVEGGVSIGEILEGVLPFLLLSAPEAPPAEAAIDAPTVAPIEGFSSPALLRRQESDEDGLPLEDESILQPLSVPQRKDSDPESLALDPFLYLGRQMSNDVPTSPFDDLYQEETLGNGAPLPNSLLEDPVANDTPIEEIDPEELPLVYEDGANLALNTLNVLGDFDKKRIRKRQVDDEDIEADAASAAELYWGKPKDTLTGNLRNLAEESWAQEYGYDDDDAGAQGATSETTSDETSTATPATDEASKDGSEYNFREVAINEADYDGLAEDDVDTSSADEVTTDSATTEEVFGNEGLADTEDLDAQSAVDAKTFSEETPLDTEFLEADSPESEQPSSEDQSESDYPVFRSRRSIRRQSKATDDSKLSSTGGDGLDLDPVALFGEEPADFNKKWPVVENTEVSQLMNHIPQMALTENSGRSRDEHVQISAQD